MTSHSRHQHRPTTGVAEQAGSRQARAGGRELTTAAVSATLHCLTGCAIGEVLGMALATWWGWSNGPSIALAIVLAFAFGYGLTASAVLRAGLSLRQAVGVALAADTVSILTMEIMDNAVILALPGAMDGRLGRPAVLGQPCGVAGGGVRGDGSGEPCPDRPGQGACGDARLPPLSRPAAAGGAHRRGAPLGFRCGTIRRARSSASRPAADRGRAMRWDELFADLEAQAEALQVAERDAEVAELTRLETSRLTLASRLRPRGGQPGPAALPGRNDAGRPAQRVRAGWLLLDEGPAGRRWWPPRR